ncbi:MAG TPA: ATP-binding cassette domain-containing protein, partial [Acidimicrobiales bacterium]|nr:ATP-binding cassette domain-containing protein [Acidimicrobiales bacterium]
MTSTNGRSVTTSRRRAPLRAEAGGVPDLGTDETLVLDTPVANGHRPADAADRAAAPEVGTETILKCSGIDVSYGPVQILFGVDLEVKRGEVVALLGTNGAGKSTLLKAICGLKAPKAGTVEFKGEDITGLSADLVADKGAALMPGGKGIFPTLTVAENLRLASWLIKDDPQRVKESKAEVLELFPILSERSNQLAGDLSGGEQQMLALGGALMTSPELLMIDELSLGLAPTIVARLLEVVDEIHRRGTTIIVVEQSVNVALNLAERAVFMEKGEFRFTGPTRELLDRPDILRSVFIAGGKADEADDADKAETGAQPKRVSTVAEDARAVLQCRGVTKRFGGITAVDSVDVDLHDGEIIGLIGHNGAGKTTLMDCISGFLAIEDGRIGIQGLDVTDWQPHERARAGLGRSFQDAR